MLSNLPHKRLMITFIILLVLIPSTSLVLSQRLKQISQPNKSYDRTQTLMSEVPTTSPIKDLLKSLETPSTTPSASETQDLGPTLKLAVNLQGRPQADQHTKLFVGIIEGTTIPDNPQYLLSFNVDVPASGQYSNISLVGLTQGLTYTAILKGSTQIATSSAFIMGPNGATLNNSAPITMLTGDFNQDNIIDQSDLDIINAAYGKTSKASDWNPNLDLNLDGIINSIDISIVSKNLGQVGITGKWYSPTPQASSSANLITPPNVGGEGATGHWEWIPGN